MPPGIDLWALAVSCAISVVLSARWSKHTTLGRLALIVYVASNAISSCVCTLLLLEVLNPSELVLRADLWHYFTMACLGSLVLALPAVQIGQYFVGPFDANTTRRRPKYGAALITFVFYLASVFFAVHNFPGGNSEHWGGLLHKLQTAVSSLGLTMMAGICGFSSISATYTAFFQRRSKGSEAALQRLQVSVSNTDSLIKEQELQISRLRMEYARRGVNPASPSSPDTQAGGGFLNNIVPRIAGIFRHSESAALQEAEAEYTTLRQLRSEFAAELEGLKAKVDEERFAQTFKGKLWTAAFAVFAVYCFYRVAMGYVRMGWYLSQGTLDTKRSPPRDAVVMWIAELANYYQPDLSPDDWARFLGLLVSVCIIITSVRGARNTATLLLKKLRKSHTSELVKLDPISAAGVFAIYTLAIGTALQLNIPRMLSGGLRTTVNSGLTVESVQLLNDVVLCVTSTITIVLLVLTAYLNTERVDDIESVYEKYD